MSYNPDTGHKSSSLVNLAPSSLIFNILNSFFAQSPGSGEDFADGRLAKYIDQWLGDSHLGRVYLLSILGFFFVELFARSVLGDVVAGTSTHGCWDHFIIVSNSLWLGLVRHRSLLLLKVWLLINLNFLLELIIEVTFAAGR